MWHGLRVDEPHDTVLHKCPTCADEAPAGPNRLTRRMFLKSGALALAGVALSPGFLTRAALAASSQGRVLVVVFQRGAADGLNMVVPYTEDGYYRMRRTTAVGRPRTEDGCIDLDGQFGLHPSLEPLKALYDRRTLAVVHATGSPDNTRSHFDAQDYMESGVAGTKSVADGWLNRSLARKPPVSGRTFRAVSFTTSLPRSLAGSEPALAIPSLREFGVRGGGQAVEKGFEAMYAKSVHDVLRGTGKESFQAVEALRKKVAGGYSPANGASYPRGQFGQQMMQVAQLIKADVGLEIACTESGGWDTHANQGAGNGQMANRLQELSNALAAFARDMGDRMRDVVVLTMSEFGRTMAENGSGGTDHGHASCNFVLGGPVRGGKVYGPWPGLDANQLYEGRDLALTTDFRDVFGEVVVKFLACPRTEGIFPGYTIGANRFRNFLA